MAGKNVLINVLLNLGNSPAQVQALSAKFDGATASVRRFAQGTNELVNSLQPLGRTLSIGITAPITALGIASFNSAKQMDSLTRGLTAVAGSTAEAEKQLGRLKEVAKLPGLGFREAIEGSINLQAAGLSAQFSERALKAFGNALATVGKGKAELDRVNLALTQIANNEFLQGDELNQLRDAVPQVSKLLKEAFGTVDTEKLKKAGVTSKQVLDVLLAQLERLPQVTGGAQNATENLADAYDQAMAKIGKATLSVAVPAIERLTPAIEKVGNAFAGLSPETQKAAIYLGGFAALIGPVIIGAGAVVGGLGNLVKAASATAVAMGSASAGTGLLGALAAVNPVTAVATFAVLAGAAAWYQYSQATQDAAYQIEQSSRRARGAVKLLTGEETRVVTLPDGRQINVQPGKDLNAPDDPRTQIKIKGIGVGDAGFSPLSLDTNKPVPKFKLPPDKKGKGSKKETELEQLQGQLKDINAELKIFSNATSAEFLLKLQIAGLTEAKSEIEELLKLQREANLQPDIPQRNVQTGKGRSVKIFDFAAIQERAGRLKGDFGIETGNFGGLNNGRELLTVLKEGLLKQQGDVLEKQVQKQQSITDLLSQTEESLREQLEDLESGGTGRSTELSLRRQLRKAGANLEGEKEQEALGLARAVDEQKKYMEAVEDSRRATERFREELRNTFEDALGRLLRGDVKGAGGILKNFGANLGSQSLSGLLFGGGGQAAGGGRGNGGGGILGSLRGLLGGGNSGGGGGILGGLLGPGGTAPFNPASGGGGFLRNLTSGGGLLNGLLGGGSRAAAAVTPSIVGGLPVLPGVALPGLTGSAGAAGAAGGGLSLSSLGAFFTNPITAIVAGAAIGGFLLYRHFRNNDLKKLRDIIKGQHGIDVKDQGTLKSIREIGKANFGKEYERRLNETVNLPTVRELLANYAENTGQSSPNLISKARLGDRYDNVNIVRRQYGGIIPGTTRGFDHVPALLDGGESVLNAAATRRIGRTGVDALNSGAGIGGGAQPEMMAALMGMLGQLHEAITAYKPKSPNDVAMAVDDHVHAQSVRRGYNADSGIGRQIAYDVNR